MVTENTIKRDCFTLLGVTVDVLDINKACLRLKKFIDDGIRSYVCVAPVSTIVDCQKNEDYRNIINQADMVTPDGMPVVWYGRMKGHKALQRTYGPDLMSHFCLTNDFKLYRHFFYGSDQNTLRKLVDRLKFLNPNIQIAGQHAPSFQEIGKVESDAVLKQINESKSDVLWVGLGSPKQDVWMVNHRMKLDVPVMVGVGAAFDFIAQTKPQAPKWMQRYALEWAFRLFHEPRRLWKRYLIGNSTFVFLILKEFFTKKNHA